MIVDQAEVLSMNLLNTADVLRRAPVLIVSFILGKKDESRGYFYSKLFSML